MKNYLDVSEEVRKALLENKPVVALESTIISHGMPYPKNVETALMVEEEVRKNGAVPATIAIIGGRLKASLTSDEIEYFGKKGTAITKASRRDIPAIIARKEDGATTVAATMIIAALAGIDVFATGGIGGVHRGAQETMDVLPHTHIGKSEGHIHGFSHSLNIFLTILSSSEWNVMTHILPLSLRISTISLRFSSSTFSSPLSSILIA